MTRFLAEQLSTAHWFDQRDTRRVARLVAGGLDRRGAPPARCRLRPLRNAGLRATLGVDAPGLRASAG